MDHECQIIWVIKKSATVEWTDGLNEDNKMRSCLSCQEGTDRHMIGAKIIGINPIVSIS